MAEESRATVIILCRNNPGALERSLSSALIQQPPCVVLVMDGSDDDGCERVVRRRLSHGKLRYQRAAPVGPYATMNAALALVTTPWLHFLHSGDHFVGESCIAALVGRAQWLRSVAGHLPAAVFGQAVIEADGDERLQWLSPDPRMRSVQRWLRHMVPCHQAVLFSTAWAQHHPYDARNSICADRPVMRLALQQSGPHAYLREPICRYRLDGISSQLPTWSELQRRWREPARTPAERLGELGKCLLRPLGAFYPWLMRFRSRLMGWWYR